MTSILDGLAARREALVAKRTRTVPVPDWTDPGVSLRLKPLETSVIERIGKAALKSTRDDQTVAGQAAIVAAATIEVIVGTEHVSLKDLGAKLGLTDPDAGDVIRALCITDGHVKAMADAVIDISGHTEPVSPVDEDLAGE